MSYAVDHITGSPRCNTAECEEIKDVLPAVIDIPESQTNNRQSSNGEKKIVPPGGVDIRQHGEGRTGIGDVNQIEKTRDYLPGFIELERVQYPLFSQLISCNNEYE